MRVIVSTPDTLNSRLPAYKSGRDLFNKENYFSYLVNEVVRRNAVSKAVGSRHSEYCLLITDFHQSFSLQRHHAKSLSDRFQRLTAFKLKKRAHTQLRGLLDVNAKKEITTVIQEYSITGKPPGSSYFSVVVFDRLMTQISRQG